jgi:predicted nucleic acid-binding protein
MAFPIGMPLFLPPQQSLGCDTLYTEDLNPGQTYGAIRVVNPFS